MARPKKGEGKADASDSATLQVSRDDFVRTRDSVVTGLANLQSAVQDLSRAYIAHTNSVLGRAPSNILDPIGIATAFGDGALLAGRPAAPANAVETAEGKEKKKKKRHHDPNAPKRPLTPYFLFMKSARSVIASDLGPNAKPGDVSNEGTRRWQAMPEGEKSMWQAAYKKDLDKYNEKVAAYKASLAQGDAAAAQLAAENVAMSDGDTMASAADVTKTPSSTSKGDKPKKVRRKSGKESTDASAEVIMQHVMTPVGLKQTVVLPPGSDAKDKSKEKSEKKRKRSDKKSSSGDAEGGEKSKTKSDGTPKDKEKKNKRKRKSDAVEAA